MANNNENFKVRHGLKVGDTITATASSGDITTTGDVTGDGVRANGDLTAGGNTLYSSSNKVFDFSGANATITGNLTVSGDLTVNGTATTIDTTNLVIEDNTIVLNKNEGGAGVTAGSAGIEIERGSEANVLWQFNETYDWWEPAGGTGASQQNIWAGGYIIAGTELQTNGNRLVFNNDDSSPNATVEIQVKRNAADDAYIRWDETTDRWQTSVNGGTTWIDIPNQDLDTDATPTFYGITSGNLTVGLTDDNTITSTNTNGNITLAPNGTGDVALTLNNGGNLTNTRNYVFGAIRNSTTDSNGDIWVLDADAGGAGTLPVRGVSIDNSSDTAKTAGAVLRNYSNTAGFAPRVVFERARGTAASPTTLSSGDLIGVVAGTGYTSTTGWINDTLPFAPAAMTFTSAEAWVSNTNLGTAFNVALAPSATTITTAANLITTITHNPQAATYRSDAFTFRQGKSGTTNFLTLGTAAANLSADTVTLETSAGTDMLVLTTASGALKADSIVLETSAGTDMLTLTTANAAVKADNITLETSAGTDMMTLTTSAANIISTATNIRNASNTQQVGISGGGAGQETELKINKENATGTPVSSEVATINFTTTRASGNASQSGDKLGQFKFNGSLTTGGTAAPTCSINGYAAENFTATAQGGRFIFQTNKIGTTTSYNPIYVDSGTMELSSDAIYFKNSAGTAQTSAGINYTRTYGEFAYTNAAGFAIAAQNTIYAMPLDTTLNNSGVTISNTSRININVSGWYKIIMSLQATLTVSNQPAQFDFWLRCNGSDVANSKTQVDLLKDQKSVISMDWLVNSDGNDYWEIVYVGTTTNYADVDFPTIAATTTPYVSPVAPALLVNVIPAGM